MSTSPTTNRIIPIIGAIVLLIALVIVLKTFNGKSDEPVELGEIPVAPTPDADTPADTVRTLSAQVADFLEQTKALTEENKQLREQNADALALEDRIESRLREELRTEREKKKIRAQNRDDSVLSSLTARIDQLSGKLSLAPAPAEAPGLDDMPVGFGYGDGTTVIHWIEPLGAPIGDAAVGAASHAGFSGSLLRGGPAGTSMAAQADPASFGDRPAIETPPEPEPRPVYTIPVNSTLDGSIAYTALVGRVPVGGRVEDPMQFKALIGADNLAANGHRIPGLEGMVVSGYASGDWTLSCVRGTVTSALFVFEDGSVVTFGEKQLGQGNKEEREAIGWISDRFGVPCISGKRITNAPQFLTQRIGITALEAAAAAAAASQTTNIVDSGVASSTVTGDTGRYVLGQTVSGGASEVNKWLLERQAQSFDAIFVAAGEPLAVHLDVNLPIDYDPGGRRLDHRTPTAQGGIYGYLD